MTRKCPKDLLTSLIVRFENLATQQRAKKRMYWKRPAAHAEENDAAADARRDVKKR